jgi:hypothetical protein
MKSSTTFHYSPNINMPFLSICNSGPEIADTNFWDSELANKGFIYLSWNAGVARLMVPESFSPQISEMQTGSYCIISERLEGTSGAYAMELLFEDGTAAPYCLHISAGQTDRLNACKNRDEGFSVAVWTRNGKEFEMPGKYRKVKKLPCLAPWRWVNRLTTPAL